MAKSSPLPGHRLSRLLHRSAGRGLWRRLVLLRRFYC